MIALKAPPENAVQVPRPVTLPRPGARVDFAAHAHEHLFGWMHEDAGIEREVFAPGARVFAIASAGCTAFALADAGHDVTAVDMLPGQLAYARARRDGATAAPGRVDKLLNWGRGLVHGLTVPRATLRAFLALNDPAEQAAVWARRIDTPLFGCMLDLGLHPRALRLAYAPALVDALPKNFAQALRRRLARGFARHPNATNPHAWRLWLDETPPGAHPPRAGKRPGHVDLLVADAAYYLESCSAQSFGAFTLSNILDGASAEYGARLFAAVRRAARPGAKVVWRSFAEPLPGDEAAAAWALRDRSMLWGQVNVRAAETL